MVSFCLEVCFLTNGVFSDFEIDKCSVKFVGDSSCISMDCIGSVEEEATVKNITKMCRGVLFKETVTGTGDGTLKMSAHIPWEVSKRAFGLELDSVIDGVVAYGKPSRHRMFSMAFRCMDEDGIVKYKFYPKCIIKSGYASKITNGAEEVAETEMEVTFMPDDFGIGCYQKIVGVDGDINPNIINNWLSLNISSDDFQVASSDKSITYNLTNLSIANSFSSISDGSDFVNNIIPDDGYSLPSSISVSEGGSSLSAGTDYIYSSSSGLISIPDVSGNIVITATGSAIE